MGLTKGKQVAGGAVILLVVVGFGYWFYARSSCGENARIGGSVESQIYGKVFGQSDISEERFQGCMRTYGF